MRTVHEPELPRGANPADPVPPSRTKGIKLKLAPNGTSSTPSSSKPPLTPTALPGATDLPPTTLDEDGNAHPTSAPNDNITYIPAHHPITGQPGFMIHYPADIHFTPWESSIPADNLMRLLRRQLHWAEKENQELTKECEMLEEARKEEWTLKEILMEGVLEAELVKGVEEGALEDMDSSLHDKMSKDIAPAQKLGWTPRAPDWRRARPLQSSHLQYTRDAAMPDRPSTPDVAERTPSPPPTGQSGGFDGDRDPYDNYVGDQMAHFEQLRAQREKERMRGQSLQGTPVKQNPDADREADAVGALMGMSGGTRV
jgi:hypothetical protein